MTMDPERQSAPRGSMLATIAARRRRPGRSAQPGMDTRMKTPFDANDCDAPWLVVPLVLALVLIAGLALIFGWSIG